MKNVLNNNRDVERLLPPLHEERHKERRDVEGELGEEVLEGGHGEKGQRKLHHESEDVRRGRSRAIAKHQSVERGYGPGHRQHDQCRWERVPGCDEKG